MEQIRKTLKLMGEKKQQQSKNGNERKVETNGVIIRVYVESSRTRYRKHSDPAKKSQIERPRTPQSQGYDRRALLLAHSRKLRNPGSESHQDDNDNVQFRKEENRSWFQFFYMPLPQRLLRLRRQRRRTYGDDDDHVPLVEKEELMQPRKRKSTNGKTSSWFRWLRRKKKLSFN